LTVFIRLKNQYDTDIKQHRQTASDAQNAYHWWLPVQLKEDIKQLYKGKNKAQPLHSILLDKVNLQTTDRLKERLDGGGLLLLL